MTSSMRPQLEDTISVGPEKPQTLPSSHQVPNPAGGFHEPARHPGDPIVPTSLDVDHKISLITILLSYAAYEGQVYWQWNTLFVTINSAMMGLFVAVFDRLAPIIIVLLSVFGVAISLAWRRVLIYGKFLAEKWREDARAVAYSDPVLRDTFRALLKAPRIPAPAKTKPSQVTKSLAICFQVLWTAIGIYGVVRLASDVTRLYLQSQAR